MGAKIEARWFPDYLKIKKLPLEDILDAYRKHSILNEKKQYKNDDHFKAAYADTLYPFSLFINKFTQNGYIKVPFALMNHILPEIFK